MTVAIGTARADRKRRTIIDAAGAVFLEHGFSAAGMDEIAARAGASKVTVYNYFSDKQSLFVAVVRDAIERTAASTRTMVEHLGDSDDVEADLGAFARQHVVDVTQPDVIRMRRVIIAEAARFPELARAWHRAGPEQAHAVLARQIGRLARRGVLRAPDPVLAAQNLNYLILSVPLNEAMFAATDRPPSRRRLHRYADEAVRVFLAGYAADSPTPAR